MSSSSGNFDLACQEKESTAAPAARSTTAGLKPVAAFPISAEGKVQVACQYKDQGNAIFKEGKYKKALVTYAKALAFIRGLPGRHQGLDGLGKMAAEARKGQEEVLGEEVNQEINALEVNLNNNMSLCHAKLENVAEAVKYAEAAIALNPAATKAFVRKAEAITITKNYDKALKCYDEALRVAAESEKMFIIKAKAKLVDLDKKATQKQDKKMRGFFDKLNSSAPEAAAAGKAGEGGALANTTTETMPASARPATLPHVSSPLAPSAAIADIMAAAKDEVKNNSNR